MGPGIATQSTRFDRAKCPVAKLSSSEISCRRRTLFITHALSGLQHVGNNRTPAFTESGPPHCRFSRPTQASIVVLGNPRTFRSWDELLGIFKTDRQTDRHTHSDRHTHTERQRDTHTERQRHTHRTKCNRRCAKRREGTHVEVTTNEVDIVLP